jgi:hypothetical protein
MTVQDSVPYHDALLAIATVSAVLWTGGLITRQLSNYMDIPFRVGLEYLGFAFIAPLFALFVQGRTLQIGAALFSGMYLIVLYNNFMYAYRVQRGVLPLPEPLNVTPENYKQNLWMYVNLNFLSVAVILIIVVYPENIAIAWSSVIMTFLGYQFLLGKILSLQQDVPLWHPVVLILQRVTEIDQRLAQVIQNPVQNPEPASASASAAPVAASPAAPNSPGG